MSLTRAGFAGCVVALLASAVTGCSGASHDAAASKPAAPAADIVQQNVADADRAASGTTTRDGHADTSESGTAVSGTGSVRHASESRTGSAGASSAAARTQKAGLRGSAPYVWSLRAAVTPTCVAAGGTATVTVHTAADAALAYVAVYAGDKSGAPKPFGYGYGGNANGYSNDSGQWASTWTIRADAPRGPAKVTVVAASHQTTKQVDVPFTVVDPVTGHC
jgi:hypothetical protein